MQSFDEGVFRNKVNTALERVRTILDNTRKPQLPADVSHSYEDKYLLAEYLTNSAIAGLLSSLEALGLNEKQLIQLKEWAKTRSVTIRLKAEEHCKFLRKVVRDVESDTKHVTSSTVFGTSKSFTVTKVTEYFWQFDVKYELLAFMGNEPDKALVLQGRAGAVELVTSADATPKPVSHIRPSIDINITWLLTHIDAANKGTFSIDRLDKSCHTPRRNAQIDQALAFLASLYQFAGSVHDYFTRDVFPVQPKHGLDLSAIKEASLFVPVVPLFEKAHKSKKHSKEAKDAEGAKPESARALVEVSASRVLPNLLAPFLAEQARSIAEKFKELSSAFSVNEKLITVAEAKLLVLLLHVRQICQSFAEGVDYIESMLFKQLVAAIGKEVTPVDFTNYLRFHNRKLFKAEYQPRPFSYAIRRPDHYPEGTLSIEAQLDDGALADPIHTTVCWSAARRPMRFSIDASTEVAFLGERFLHGWVSHQFSGYSGLHLSLVARARQFSSFILLVGSIASADLFVPKYGIIVQNKDELKIPLLLETIPTPKEFKEAISSLSPEQQRFSKGFRSMQLESTLFGVCVIQIKPQLEKLLNLPDDSLTKEIQLTQELLNLFIEYQIPSDLISYNGEAGASVSTKLDTVKRYVAAMKTMIAQSQKAQLSQAVAQQQYRRAEEDIASSDDDEDEVKEEKEEEGVEYRRAPVKRKGGGGLFGKLASGRGGGVQMRRADAAPSAPAPRSHSAKALMAAAPPPAPSSAPAAAAAPAAPAPAPAAAPATPSVKGKPEEATTGDAEAEGGEVVDYTKIPTEMEHRLEALDEDSALRPTIITPSTAWSRKAQKALLAAPETAALGTEEQGKERTKTFDLLDALTKSGLLSVDQASLHVVIAATHCFDKSLMNTVLQDNINPIEKLERSSLIVASTIQGRTPTELIANDQLERVGTYSPMLMDAADDQKK